jgi:hypothetical protein
MDYLQLSPKDIITVKDNLDDSTYEKKFKLDFPDKEIIDKDNIKLNYWITYYFILYEQVGKIRDKVIDKNNEISHNPIVSSNLFETSNLYLKLGIELKDLEVQISNIKQYAEKKRIEKYKFWPKIANNEKEMKNMDVLYQGGGFWVIKSDNQIFPITAINTKDYPIKLNTDLYSILSYIYLERFFTIYNK